MKEKNPEFSSEEKEEESYSKTKSSFQSEEKPIPDDDEWFDGQDGKGIGYYSVHRGILTPSEEMMGGKAISKEATKSFLILGMLLHQKKKADLLRQDMIDAIGEKRVKGLKKSQLDEDTIHRVFTESAIRQKIKVGWRAASRGITKTELATKTKTRPDTERLLNRMIFYGLIDTFEKVKSGKEAGDLFFYITDLGINAFNKIKAGGEGDPLQYYYDIISGSNTE